jgi:hypothetical protein
VVDDSAGDAAQQQIRQPALPVRADDDRAGVVRFAEVEDRAPHVPIGAHDKRTGVEAGRARESGTLLGGRASVGALEFVDLAEDRRVRGGSCGRADREFGQGARPSRRELGLE